MSSSAWIGRSRSIGDTAGVDGEKTEVLAMALLERGVRAITGGHWYVSAAHTDALVDETLNVFEDALAAI